MLLFAPSRVSQLQVWIRMHMPIPTRWGWWAAQKKVEEKWWKGPVALLKESIQLGCVSQGSHPRKSVLRKGRKLGSNHTIKFSKGMSHHIKIHERKGPSRGVIQKCEPHERNPCAPRFEERTQEETLHQERWAHRVAWNLAKNVYKLKNTDKATFYSPIEARATPAPTSKSPEERELVVDSGASMHMLGKKDLSSEELETLRRSGPHNGGNGRWRNANKRGSTSIRSRSWSLRDGANTWWHACSWRTRI